ncbi:MAG TPA: NAD-dependent malic enzyme [Cellulomonas sp.]|uniref:NAD-dependent malic enzyme n=1 Tax=Cellulomonas sp. TaxID=40001 RepID=UPI002E2F1424|nr:NAD-dependent malic enzyme [Cellulomonas sp.]HEX5332180.1 NAD-dependent malic enzyme [Cellulomonas sp.]
MTVLATPSAAYTLTLRVELSSSPGTLGRLTTVLGAAGANIGSVDVVSRGRHTLVRDIQVFCRDEAHGTQVMAAARTVAGTTVASVTDRTFALHQGGKIEITPRFALDAREDLSIAYTPGVGRISSAIAQEPELVWDLTIKRNSVAVLTDGSAVLGLGDLGPCAALPVMEGKAMLFKQFAGIDAYPICANAHTIEELVALGVMIAPGFGGINLEDISAPRCFEVERRLQDLVDIPVFHDDQHGTATVVLAALINSARVIGRRLDDLRVVVLGVGAAGVAITRLLLDAGVSDILAVDKAGILHPRMADLDPERRWIAEHTNPERRTGGVESALRGADVFVGVSGPDAVRPEWLRSMGPDAIVFPMANPVPEIMPEAVPPNVRILGTGRSDYPNQINNTLIFPGFFRGLLDARARTVLPQMRVAAAHALADVVAQDGPTEDYVVPSVFDPRIVPAVAAAVQQVQHAASRPVTAAAAIA